MKVALILILAIVAQACSEAELEAPAGQAIAKPVPENWYAHVDLRNREIKHHIDANPLAYAHFANFPVSKTDGVPYLLLKLLPIVAPSLWPDDENFLSVIGLYHDERQPDYPIALGIGFTGISRDLSKQVADRASFTCGGCHIGRLKKADNNYQYLDGGINSEFNVVGFRKRMVRTFDELAAGEDSREKQNKIVVEKFLNALEWAEQERPNYFYKNYSFNGRHFDSEYENQQIALFREQASTLIIEYKERINEVYEGWKVLVEKNYNTAYKDLMSGFGGMEDAIAFNSVDAYLSLKKTWYTSLFSSIAIASEPGITDIMAVWNQQNRNPQWNKEETDLVNGGGQWNGHIPLLIYKNLAAQLTLGVNNVDVAVSSESEKLLEKLPAPAYPFKVDVELAKKGRQLFQKNCVECHRDNNGKVYRNIGTNFGRAKIAGPIITIGAQSSFTDVCGPKTKVISNGVAEYPCASYKGVALKDKKKLAMTSYSRHDGYNALPLTGIWAQAPYLHNGSIPTIYHLLMPEERPDVFIKSQLQYDQEKMGFVWQKNQQTEIADGKSYSYNTAQADSLSNKGHDKDVKLNGKTYRLDWSDDEDSVKAIIEYMKTL